MNQITIRELRCMTSEKLKKSMPCQVVSDGEVLALLVPQDASQAKSEGLKRMWSPFPDASHRTERKQSASQFGRFSKEAQAKGVMGL